MQVWRERAEAAGLKHLNLRAGGLRFTNHATEQDYRAWYVREALMFTRLGMAASIVAWVGIFVAGCFLPDGAAKTAPWAFGLVIPLIIVSLVSTFRTRWHRAVLNLTAFTNAVAGLVCVHWCGDIFHQPMGVGVGTGAFSFFALVVFRLHPGRACLAALTYDILAPVLLLKEYHQHLLSSSGLVAGLGGPLIQFAAALTAAVAIERALRQSFRQLRVIEAQEELLDAERQRSESLLANMLPEPIAVRLKANPTAIADSHDQVTVLFADIVGFTPLSARLRPGEIVAFLNHIFTRFDRLAVLHGVEKIKTIGDAWMAVAGIPEARPDHAHAIAALAMDMAATLDDLRQVTGRQVEFRIGIESGPVVAGVIGTSKFAYDLWGDTVNTAARLESHGVPSRIQVGHACFELLQGHYEFAPRGLVDLKGKGPTKAYFLTGRTCTPVCDSTQAETRRTPGPLPV